MKGEAKTKRQRDDGPVQRVLKAEPVEKTSSKQMEKQMSEKRRLKLKARKIQRRNQQMSNKIKAEMNWFIDCISAKIAESGIKPARSRARAPALARSAPVPALSLALAATAASAASAALAEAKEKSTLQPQAPPPTIDILQDEDVVSSSTTTSFEQTEDEFNTGNQTHDPKSANVSITISQQRDYGTTNANQV